MTTVHGDPATDHYLGDLVDRSRSVLTDRLVGVYLVNSGARDDYFPGRSDLDVAVIVERALDDRTKHDLVDRLRHRSLPCPSPRLELVVYRRAVAAAPGHHPAFELNLNTGPAIADRVSIDPGDEPSHWFVLDLATANDRAARLVGPPAIDVFGQVPDPVVLDALRASQAWHAAHDAVAPNRVLNDCRAWRWVAERRWSSKSEAAAWAIRAGGDRHLIERALARRRGESADPLPEAAIVDLARRVADEIDLAAGALGG
jgi:hypothetical protein